MRATETALRKKKAWPPTFRSPRKGNGGSKSQSGNQIYKLKKNMGLWNFLVFWENDRDEYDKEYLDVEDKSKREKICIK